MSIATIEHYVEDLNRWGAVFGSPPVSLMNAADRQQIAASLDSALSPENLSCDGEVRGAELQTKYRYLTRAAKELQSIDPAVEFYEF